jgi:AcrR family transcriptional regulator
MPRRSQHERTETTRAALMASARTLFVEHGYLNVSAAQIAAASGVTRGAMYHHYADKQDLFRAVFEQLEVEITRDIQEALDAAPDLLTSIPMGLALFLDVCERPEVVQIGLTDAPAVLGWQEWRQIEARHGLGILTAMMERAAAEGLLRSPAEAVPTLAQIVLSSMIEAALLIAHADDRASVRATCQQSLLILLAGIFVAPAE